jgi:hypothetical protein
MRPAFPRAADLEIGGTAGWETCGTPVGYQPVPQTSKSAVSRVSKPAGRSPFQCARHFHAQPIWKSAIQQTWKSAVRAAAFSLIWTFQELKIVIEHYLEK